MTDETSNVVCVDAEPAHLDAILALTTQTGETHNARAPVHFSKIDLAVHAEKFRNHFRTAGTKPITRLFAVLKEGAVIGHVFVTLVDAVTPDTSRDLVATITDISILPEYRGKGLGRRVLDHVLAELQRMGVTRVAGYVWFDNTASAALFDAAGFARNLVLFERRLAPPEAPGDTTWTRLGKRLMALWQGQPRLPLALVVCVVAILQFMSR